MLINRLDTIRDLDELFRGLSTPLYRYVLARCNNQIEVAEEITQEVFIRAWEKRETFNPNKSSLKNWVYIIARNKVIDYFRSTKDSISLEKNENYLGDSGIEKIEDELLINDIFKGLKTLKADEQEVLILRYIQEFEIDDISKIINKNKIATKVMIHRAIKKLKEAI